MSVTRFRTHSAHWHAMKTHLALLMAALLLSACSKLTVQNYDRLRVGMPFEEVRAILGAPEECSDAMLARTCRWGDEKRYVTVNFVADKAVLFGAQGLR